MGGEEAMCCLDYLTTNFQDTIIFIKLIKVFLAIAATILKLYVFHLLGSILYT